MEEDGAIRGSLAQSEDVPSDAYEESGLMSVSIIVQ
jgi:hypothetical protein